MSPLRFLGWVLASLIGLVLVGAVAFTLYGREESWVLLAGPADLGPYDFRQPTRTGKLNDTLACPAGTCVKGLPDLETPHYGVPGRELFAVVQKIIRHLPGKVRLIGANPVAQRLRAVVYSPAVRIPATLSVMVESTNDGGADLYVYSRSQIGYYDMGRNTANIAALMEAIATELSRPATPPAAAPPKVPAAPAAKP
jgi:hypothetical protein